MAERLWNSKENSLKPVKNTRLVVCVVQVQQLSLFPSLKKTAGRQFDIATNQSLNQKSRCVYIGAFFLVITPPFHLLQNASVFECTQTKN